MPSPPQKYIWRRPSIVPSAGDDHDLIVELIRLSDGAHPFARYYDDETRELVASRYRLEIERVAEPFEDELRGS